MYTQMPLSFRRRPPRKTFHTIEFGAGDAKHLQALAEKHPSRLYAAVDPAYRIGGNYASVRGTRYQYDRPTHTRLRSYAQTMEDFIAIMKTNGLKTRRIVVRMPDPDLVSNQTFKMEQLIHDAKHVLVPNGKMIITTENNVLASKIINAARAARLTIRETRLVPPAVSTALKGKKQSLAVPRSEFELKQAGSAPGNYVWSFELTFGLKRALPEKEDRKKWPHH